MVFFNENKLAVWLSDHHGVRQIVAEASDSLEQAKERASQLEKSIPRQFYVGLERLLPLAGSRHNRNALLPDLNELKLPSERAGMVRKVRELTTKAGSTLQERQRADSLNAEADRLENAEVELSAALEAVQDAQAALDLAESRLLEHDRKRPPLNKKSVSQLEGEISTQERELAKVDTLIAQQHQGDATPAAPVDLGELLAAEALADPDQQAQASQRVEEARQAVAAQEADRERARLLLAGLERKRANINDGLAKLQLLRREAVSLVLRPELAKAEGNLIEILTRGELVKAVATVDALRRELSAAGDPIGPVNLRIEGSGWAEAEEPAELPAYYHPRKRL